MPTKLHWSKPCLPVLTKFVLLWQTTIQKEGKSPELCRITATQGQCRTDTGTYPPFSPPTRAGLNLGSCNSSVHPAFVSVYSTGLQLHGNLYLLLPLSNLLTDPSAREGQCFSPTMVGLSTRSLVKHALRCTLGRQVEPWSTNRRNTKGHLCQVRSAYLQ